MRRITIRILLGALTICVSLALPAGAGATVFSVGDSPATLSAEYSGGLVMTTEAGELKCTASVKGSLSEPSASLSLEPTLSACKAFGLEAAVNLEGCGFVLHGGSEVAEEEYSAPTDISCPTGKSVKISVGTCALEVGAQTGLTGATAKEETSTYPEHFTLKDSLTKVVYTVTKDGFLCAFNGTGKKEEGKISGSARFKGTSESLGEVPALDAPVDVVPSPMKFTGINQLTKGGVFFNESRAFEMVGQFLEVNNGEFKHILSSAASCPAAFTPPKGTEGTKCGFEVQTTNLPGVGATDTLVSQWQPVGAIFTRTIRTLMWRWK